MSNQAPDQPDEQRPANERHATQQPLLWAVLGIILLLVIVLLPLLAQSNNRPLKPLHSTPTPGSLVVESEPLLVAFPELNDDPFNYLNQRIRVTGDYTPLPPPDCTPFSGRRIRWALVAENLQMNATGFEPVLRLVEPDTTLTVEGIWRLYSGPAGCGKEPPSANVWYLEVERIVQPNPLTGFSPPVIPGPAFPVTPSGPVTTPSGGTTVPTTTPTLTPAASATTIMTPALTPAASATATATAGTPTPPVAGTLTATATATSTSTATGQATVTFTPPSGPTPTPEATVPGLATATPGGYPGQGTPQPSPTSSYP